MSNSTSSHPTKHRARAVAKPCPDFGGAVPLGGDLRADIEMDELAGLQPECIGDLMEYADRLITLGARRAVGVVA